MDAGIDRFYGEWYARTPYTTAEEVEGEWTRFKVLLAVRCPTKVIRKGMHSNPRINPRCYWNGNRDVTA